MNDYPEKYNRLLKDDEQVIWHSMYKGGISDQKLIFVSILIVLVAITLIIISFFSNYPFGLIILFSFPIISWISEQRKLNKSYHLVTNKRIIIDTTPRSKFIISSYYYDKISAILLSEHNNIIAVIDTNPDSNLEFKELENPEKTYQQIHDVWKKEFFKEKESKERRYSLLDKTLKPIAEKNGWKYTNKNPKLSNAIDIDGMVNNMPFQFRLVQKEITMIIKCPNIENNHLRIVRESMGASLGKIMGIQDIVINDEKFDNRFILQSDNEHFLKTILDSQMRNDLMEASKILDWEINFGIKKPKVWADKKKGNEDILDDEFIIENKQQKPDNREIKTSLVYYCEDIESNSSYLPFIAKHLASNFEIMINLATNIQAYNKA